MNATLKKNHFDQKPSSWSPKKYQEIIDYYEIAGDDYAEWSKHFNMHFGYYKWGMNPFRLEPILDQMTEQVYQKLQIPEGIQSQVLDLGCGLGTSARYMARKNPMLDISGLTIVPWQVRVARQMTLEQELGLQVDILLADYTKIPYKDKSIGYTYAIESSCYAEGMGKESLIKEASRVLKKGGRFVVADFFLKHQKPLPKLVQKIADKTCKYWALPEFGEINAFEEMMHKHGFKNIEIREISWNVAPSVAYIPKTVIKFLLKEWVKNKSLKMEKERWNNALAPLLGLLLGLCRKHFGYYLISGEKI